MSDEKLLSQEEMDALLKGVDEGDVDVNEKENEDPSKVKNIDFTNQERIVKGSFPVLDRIYERLAEKLSVSVYDLMSREVEVKLSPIQILNFKQLMMDFKAPAALYIVRFSPLRGKGMVIFDTSLVLNLVENYFGGRGQYELDSVERDFTPSELRISEIVANRLLSDVALAWSPIMAIEPKFLSIETNPQLVNTNAASDMMISYEFNLLFEDKKASLFIVMPYSMLDPIREQLELGAARSNDELDPHWMQALRDEIMNIQITMSARLAEAEINLSRIKSLKEGDFIPMEIPESVSLDIEGLPVFKAKVGTSNNKCALKLIGKID